MRTFAGIGVVILLEVAALALGLVWRRSAHDRGGRSDDRRHLRAVLEVTDADAPLPAGRRCLPQRILEELAADPMLGLADVRVVQHLQPTGAGLPERSQVAASYQGWNDDVAKALAAVPGEPSAGPVPALRLTWIELRLELPGSRNAAAAERAAGPITARGGGRTGAARTMDKAVRTAVAKLDAAGFAAVRLGEADVQAGLAVSSSAGVTVPTGARKSTSASASVSASEAISALEQATSPSGLLIGLDPAHQPVVLSLFRRSPLTATVVGGLPLAQLLALRAAALGARIIVETARGDEWDPLVLGSGLDASRLAVQPVGQATGALAGPASGHAPGRHHNAATPTAPVLVLRDCGARPPYAATPHGPWTTVLTLLPYLDPRAAGQLAGADLVGLQKMSGAEAGIARQVLSMSDKDAVALPDLPEHMAVWRVHGRPARYCEVTPTAWEAALVGEPQAVGP